MLKFFRSTSKETASPPDQGNPLHIAIRANNIKEVKKQLEKASALVSDRAGRHAFHIAAEIGDLDIWKVLAKSIRDREGLVAAINTKDKTGATPIYIAAVNGNTKIIVELLKSGVDASSTNNDGATVLHAPFLAPFLKKSHVKVLSLLIPQPHVSVNALDGKDRTPLQLACAKGAYDCALVLLKADANTTLVKGGEPPLYAAAVAENPALVKALLQHGADIAQTNSSGQTLAEILNPKCEIYRIIKKHLIDRPGGARKLALFAEECLVATTLEELPLELLQIVTRSGLSNDVIMTNWPVFCSIMHAVCNKRIAASPEEAVAIRDKAKQKESVDAIQSEVAVKEVQLLTAGDPRAVFKKMRVAGRGGFGMVFQGFGPDKHAWAIKRMPHSSDKEKVSNLREATFLKDCHHRNICAYKATYECAADHELWLIMDLMEGGTLDESVGNQSQEAAHFFQEPHIAYVAGEMLQALEYLHAENVVHRDLKSQNVMFTFRGEVKLIDFGAAISVADTTVVHKDMTGSPYWMAPEVILRIGHGAPCDIWSTAVCVLELANHRPPSGSIIYHMFRVATGHAPKLDEPQKWSEGMRDFLDLCLKHDPAQRTRAPVLRRHKWVTQRACQQAEMANILRDIFLVRDFTGLRGVKSEQKGQTTTVV